MSILAINKTSRIFIFFIKCFSYECCLIYHVFSKSLQNANLYNNICKVFYLLSQNKR